MRMIVGKYLLLATVLIVGFTFLIRHRSASSPVLSGARVAQAPVVVVIRAGREDLVRPVEFTAELKPYQDVDLYGKVAGYLKTISVDIGDQVRKGQVIATLDLAPQEADLARAKAAYEKARVNYDELKEIAAKKPGLIAAVDLEDARADCDKAEADLRYAQVMVGYANIIVPFDGVITRRYVDQGALIQSGVTSSTQAMPVVHLAETSRLRMDFPVPESLVPKVKPGIRVLVQVNATGQALQGTISRVADKLDDSTRTMLAEIDIDNHSKQLTPGMYATVTVDVDRRKSALAVPVLALSGSDKSSVWVVNDQDRLEKRQVALGLQTADDVEILQGLKPGEQVVVSDAGVLTTGETVSPELRQQKSLRLVLAP